VSTDAYVLALQAYAAAGPAATQDLLQRAIAADPNYALPYGWLASLWVLQVVNSNVGAAISPAERDDLSARVRQYAGRALELDPLVPFARAALTMDATLRWRWTEAYARYASTRQIAPNDVMQYDILLLSYLGHFGEAMAAAVRGAELYAAEPGVGEMYKGWAYIHQGRYDDAAREFASAVEGLPAAALPRDFLARAHVARGNKAGALDQLRVAERIASTERQAAFLPTLAYSYGRLGEAADAKRLVEQMQAEEARGTRFGAGGWAMAHLAVGDEVRALEQLRVAARKAREHEPDEGFLMLMELRMNVTNDGVLRRPEFVEVLANIKGD
jgi:tetratricopeptide (TPR) repeat protein